MSRLNGLIWALVLMSVASCASTDGPPSGGLASSNTERVVWEKPGAIFSKRAINEVPAPIQTAPAATRTPALETPAPKAGAMPKPPAKVNPAAIPKSPASPVKSPEPKTDLKTQSKSAAAKPVETPKPASSPAKTQPAKTEPKPQPKPAVSKPVETPKPAAAPVNAPVTKVEPKPQAKPAVTKPVAPPKPAVAPVKAPQSKSEQKIEPKLPVHAQASSSTVSAPTEAAQTAMPASSVAPASTTDELYKLGAGDEIRVTVFGQPDLSGVFAIGPSGAIAYPLVGEVKAAGLSSAEMAQRLTERLQQGFVAKPYTTVEVAKFRPFFILGEVQRPGAYPYSAGMTVTKAVASAGGYAYRANRQKAFVQGETDSKEREADNGGATRIAPGDTVRIPERLF